MAVHQDTFDYESAKNRMHRLMEILEELRREFPNLTLDTLTRAWEGTRTGGIRN